MAEVRRRLLRRGIQLQFGDPVLLNGRALEALLLPIASDSSHTQRTLWPLGGPQGSAVQVASGSCGARFFSSGPRASYHHTDLRSSHNNGAPEAGLPLYRSLTAYYDILEVAAGRSGARFFSSGPRASFHRTDSCRSSHNNGAPEAVLPQYHSRTSYYDILEMAAGSCGARFFSSGPRASFHRTDRRSSHNNGAPESGLPLYRSRTAYYDILEVTAHATQSQIKTAYYKQTFRFHPDRNAGNEDAARRFGEVTEAYHVLGSANLRKKYDRGILSLEDVRTAKKPNGGNSNRKESSGQTQSTGTSSTSSPAKPMFDFDAFYQAHYGEQLERERRWKARREQIDRKKREMKSNQFNKVSELTVLLLVVPAVLLFLSFKI